ncbi:MAG: hypothetical protein ACFN4U_01215 [Candidatus Absconditicoccaceae bacterium]
MLELELASCLLEFLERGESDRAGKRGKVGGRLLETGGYEANHWLAKSWVKGFDNAL